MFLTDLVDYLDDLAGAIPENATTRAGLCVLDTLACAHGGRDRPWTQQARALAGTDGNGVTVWATGGTRASVSAAVLANAVAAHSLIHEDMHPPSRVHAGTVVIPVALALAESRHHSTAELLDSVVVGYEAIARAAEPISTDTFVDRGLRPTGVLGPFGAAAAAARLLSLTPEQTVHALGLAASTAGGTTEWAVTGTSELFFQSGHAARAGLESALLAAHGAAAADSAIDGSWGVMRAVSGGAPPAPLKATRPPKTAIEDVYFKAHPSCAFTQEAIDVARSVADEVDPQTLQKVRLRVYPAAAHYPGCDNAVDLDSIVARQMSLQYSVAASIVDGVLDPGRLAAPMDPAIRRLVERIEVLTDPDLAEGYPQRRQVVIEVETLGEAVVERRGGSNGSATAGLSSDDVTTKFSSLASATLTERARRSILDALHKADRADDAAEWIRAS